MALVKSVIGAIPTWCLLLRVVAAETEAAPPPDAWRQEAGFRWKTIAPGGTNSTGFTRIDPAHSGILFSNRLSNSTIAINRLLEIGSGVAMGDVDGDGWVDIYFCRTEGDNVLYRNRGGWRFDDITASAGVACPGVYSTGAALVDADGDGDLDLFVNTLGQGTRCFLNDGRARFMEGGGSRFARQFGATSMTFGDIEGDGDLDLYVTNYRTDTFHDHPPGLRVSTRQTPDGKTVVEPRERFASVTTARGETSVVERGEPDVLYINLGGGRFSPAHWDTGAFRDEAGKALSAPPLDWGLAAMFRDLNGDRHPDLYVCNDFIYMPDRIWLNRDGLRFQAAPRSVFRSLSLASMSVDVADINRDGFDDVFVAEMLHPDFQQRARQQPETRGGAVGGDFDGLDLRPEVTRNTLHVARGDGTYAELALFARLAATDWTWASAFLDVDLDGWEDLLVAAGTIYDMQNADALAAIARRNGWKDRTETLRSLALLPDRNALSRAFRNRRDLTFEDASPTWRFGGHGVAHGMAFGDLDNDGDLDVAMNCLHEPARIFRNDTTAPRVAVRLLGTNANTRGVGARITVHGGPVPQSQEMISGGRYLSSDDPMRVFAAGEAPLLKIEVAWRTGETSILTNAVPGRVYEISQGGARRLPPKDTITVPTWFEEMSATLNHRHEDAAFDDFSRQPLLIRKLSSLGPGVSWADLDGDGDDDLLVGGGGGGQVQVFRNEGAGRWARWPDFSVERTNLRDQTTVLAIPAAGGGARVLVGESNWEGMDTRASSFRILAFGGSAARAIEEGPASGGASIGPMAMADVDGDGALDLFVGGLAVAGRYPEAAASRLIRASARGFAEWQSFEKLGMVRGAVFSDVDSDGDPDLLLACEWDHVRLLLNEGGKLVDRSADWRLAPFKGWWNGIQTGDFDEDGRMDFVASNWGSNWREDTPNEPNTSVRLYWGDMAGDGGVWMLIGSLDHGRGRAQGGDLWRPWRKRSVVAAAIPSIGLAAVDNAAYSLAGIEKLLGDSGISYRFHEAGHPFATVFLNRGDRFDARPLPIQAQWAPSFGVAVADFNGDGHEDVFLAQNFTGGDADASPQDAGRGLVLEGDGRGGFRALSPIESGVSIAGEQRGAAVADFDGDGRVDLVVGVNGAETRLFRGHLGPSGVRVSVLGGGENSVAAAAAIRLKHGERWGPAREIRVGGGFHSQDSSALVFAGPGAPVAVWIRWPGGKVSEWPLPPNARRIEIRREGVEVR